jgi:Asp-tRNA(Asn)/Glu-tRNA(Gln) amidotransferase A subunit family amidase
MSLIHWSACETAAALRERRISARELTTAYLERIRHREPVVRAWSFLDPELALTRADEADARLAADRSVGCLHGLPLGVKDVFDTRDMPSEYGSDLLRGRRPDRDAVAVASLRSAGAVIVGKTTTSEFGMYHPSNTRNPRDPTRSAGVSSSGSAAAVVDHMVPLALGTQHTASTLLPASFCGAFGFKPSFGFTSMEGSNVLAPRLAQIGLLARSVEDLVLFASAFNPRLTQLEPLSTPPSLALAAGPGWESVDPKCADRLVSLIESLPVPARMAQWPEDFSTAVSVCIELLNTNLAERFGSQPQEQLCAPLREAIEAGRKINAERRAELNATVDRLTTVADNVLKRHDALISLSAPGEAPRLEDGPGSGRLCMPWSLCGLPTLSLPLLTGPQGLPVGVQLIGRRGGDRQLLGIAQWLVAAVQ